MDPLIRELIQQAPGLAALVLVVIIFIGFLKRAITYLETRDKALELAHKEHLEARSQMRGAMERNTVSNELLTREVMALRTDMQLIKRGGMP